MTYCHHRYGRIEYKSKAEVMVPGINPVESLEEEFFVISRSPPEIEANITEGEAASVNFIFRLCS